MQSCSIFPINGIWKTGFGKPLDWKERLSVLLFGNGEISANNRGRIKDMGDFLMHYGWAGILTALAGYLLGSISFSIIFTKFFAQKDIRDCGSGNAGATNVLLSLIHISGIIEM